MLVSVAYLYPEELERDPQAKMEVQMFDVPIETFEMVRAQLSQESSLPQ